MTAKSSGFIVAMDLKVKGHIAVEVEVAFAMARADTETEMLL
jgi:hypothetical protein